MQHTITLSILGRSVRFTPQCRIEGCLNPLHKGPCKGAKRAAGQAIKKTTAKKTTAKKTTAKKAVPAKTTAKKAVPKKVVPKTAPKTAGRQTDAERVAEVKKMTAKPLHHGYKMAYVIDRLKKLANAFGGNFERDKMTVRVTSRNGTGEMRMTPQGWQTTITRANSAPYTRNFRDVESAAAQIETLRFFRPAT